MEIELGRIYTTMGDSIALPSLVCADGKVEAFILYAADIASVYSPIYGIYHAHNGLYVGGNCNLDLGIAIYNLDLALALINKVVARGWSQSFEVTINSHFWDVKLNNFLELFRKVY